MWLLLANGAASEEGEGEEAVAEAQVPSVKLGGRWGMHLPEERAHLHHR